MAIVVKDKMFTFPATPIIMQGEKGTTTFEFDIQDTLSASAELFFCFHNSNGESEAQPMTKSGSYWTWTVNTNFTIVEGYNYVQLMAKVEDTVVWLTKAEKVIVRQGVLTDAIYATTPVLWTQVFEARDAAIAAKDTAVESAEDAEESAENASASAEDAEDSAEAAEAAQQAIEDMTVSSETLAAGSQATVTKSESGGVVNLKFGIPTGYGVPSGGTTGQVLRKKTNTDYDTEWGDGVSETDRLALSCFERLVLNFS